jgi:hypothetical protein
VRRRVSHPANPGRRSTVLKQYVVTDSDLFSWGRGYGYSEPRTHQVMDTFNDLGPESLGT